MILPQTLSAGYVVPLAIAAAAADHTVRHMPGPLVADVVGTPADDGARWFFQGIGTYRAIKRAAAHMREAMAPEESAALLVPDAREARYECLPSGRTSGGAR